MHSKSALDELRQRFPWPTSPPPLQTVDWSEDAGGRHLIEDIIQQREVSVILEVGVFLGGSARTWLNASPNVAVIGVDPWRDGKWGEYAKRRGRHEVADQLARQEGLYETFLASHWEYRDRLIPVRRSSPEALYEISNLGIKPDLVFLHADKSGQEIRICHQLFPEAIIAGDDWWWGVDRIWNSDDGYPIRGPVKAYCRKHNMYLKTSGHTWVIDEQPPTFEYQLTRPAYYMKSARRRLRGILHWIIGYQPNDRRAAA